MDDMYLIVYDSDGVADYLNLVSIIDSVLGDIYKFKSTLHNLNVDVTAYTLNSFLTDNINPKVTLPNEKQGYIKNEDIREFLDNSLKYLETLSKVKTHTKEIVKGL